MNEVPLSTLLSHALLQFARDYRRAGTEIDHQSTPTLARWCSALRFLEPEPMLVVDVPKAARLSRRMVKPLLDGYQRAGVIVVEPGAGRGKRVVRLTAGGHAMKQAWAPLMDDVTATWRERLGSPMLESARAALLRLVSQFDLEHPHFPLGYGAVDDSVTGGSAVPGSLGPPFIPPHGKDWIPVVRGDGDTVSMLPLPALLSQALVEFALQVERGREVSLSVAWMVRSLPDEGAPVRDVAATWGDNFKLDAAIRRHGIMQVEDGIVTLTSRGRALRDKQGPAIADVEARWRNTYGVDVVAALRESLEAIDSRLDDGLPDHPMLSWVGGVRVVGADT